MVPSRFSVILCAPAPLRESSSCLVPATDCRVMMRA
jgi:hypothetical protein